MHARAAPPGPPAARGGRWPQAKSCRLPILRKAVREANPSYNGRAGQGEAGGGWRLPHNPVGEGEGSSPGRKGAAQAVWTAPLRGPPTRSQEVDRPPEKDMWCGGTGHRTIKLMEETRKVTTYARPWWKLPQTSQQPDSAGSGSGDGVGSPRSRKGRSLSEQVPQGIQPGKCCT